MGCARWPRGDSAAAGASAGRGAAAVRGYGAAGRRREPHLRTSFKSEGNVTSVDFEGPPFRVVVEETRQEKAPSFVGFSFLT